jgi:multisubunit Na+/H+ antiporter MnhB subunit
VDTNRPSLLRDVVGFFGGGLVAAIAAGLVFLAFFPLPPPKPTDHTREALAVLVLVVFFCGGFIGRRAFSADFWSDLLPSIITSYVVIGFLCLISGLDFSESAPMIGFASVGIVTSAVVLLLLGRRFPPKTQNYEV